MFFPSWASLDIFSMLILTLIYMSSHSSIDYHSVQQRSYFNMLLINIVILVADFFSRLTIPSVAGMLIVTILYSAYPILAYLWFLHLSAQLFPTGNFSKNWTRTVIVLAILDLVFIALSLYIGHVYYFDTSGYHRGPLHIITVYIGMCLLLLPFAMLIRYRHFIEKRYFKSLLLFPIPPVLGTLLQEYTPNIPFIPCSIAFSLIMIFINIQNRTINMDFLTGALSRRCIEQYMSAKIKTATPKHTFGAIMIDVDNFKKINDCLGHHVGDMVLQKTVTILKSCIRPTDFVGRFGGDEFLMYIDVSALADLEAVIARIRHAFLQNNRRKQDNVTYQLNVSLGYALYDPKSGMDLHEFQHHIDMKMYQDKENKKKAHCNQ